MRLSRSLCAVVGGAIANTGSHPTLDELFISCGAPGEPPNLAHHSKWKEWLYRAGMDQHVDSLAVLGGVLEEFMDVAPDEGTEAYTDWKKDRERIKEVLEQNGLRYFRFGRVLPQGESVERAPHVESIAERASPRKPREVEELLEVVVKGLRRAMHPLTHRRKGAQPLLFSNEYDVQDLLHALLRPWIGDIRAEEFTPSYAGSSTRMDFLLPDYDLVMETKIVRDRAHAKKVGDELIIDIAHYKKHPSCSTLWCVIYDPHGLVTNAPGLVADLEGSHSSKEGMVDVRIFVL